MPMRRTSVLVLVALFCATPALAADDDLALCAQVENRAVAIPACMRVIATGQAAPEALATAYKHRGDLYRDEGSSEPALADYATAARLNQRDAAPLIERAVLHHGRDAWREAVADATEALKRDPDSGRAYNVRGDALAQLRQNQRALADLTAAMRS